MREFLRRNAWTIVTVLCDELSLFPSAATFYIIGCRSWRAVLTEKPGEFQPYFETFDSKSEPEIYAAMLGRAKTRSRSKILHEINPYFSRAQITNYDSPIMCVTMYQASYPSIFSYFVVIVIGTNADIMSIIMVRRAQHPVWNSSNMTL